MFRGKERFEFVLRGPNVNKMIQQSCSDVKTELSFSHAGIKQVNLRNFGRWLFDQNNQTMKRVCRTAYRRDQLEAKLQFADISYHIRSVFF